MAKRRSPFHRFLRYALLLVLLAGAGWTAYLDFRVRSEFEGRRFALPARIYARPMELHPGLRTPKEAVVQELRDLGYRDVPREQEYGWYVRTGDGLEIAWGWLHFQPDSELSGWFRARFGGGSSRQRRIGIVALARKLLVQLWKYLQTGVPPAGATLTDWQSKARTTARSLQVA